MNWKQEAIYKLREYEAHKRALENIPEEIKRLESAFTSVRSASADGVPVSHSGNTREDILLTNIVKRQELCRNLEQARLWVDMVDTGLKVIDGEERLVLERFYINRAKGNVDRLCKELCLEKSAVYSRRDAALRHFTIALYGITES